MFYNVKKKSSVHRQTTTCSFRQSAAVEPSSSECMIVKIQSWLRLLLISRLAAVCCRPERRRPQMICSRQQLHHTSAVVPLKASSVFFCTFSPQIFHTRIYFCLCRVILCLFFFLFLHLICLLLFCLHHLPLRHVP